MIFADILCLAHIPSFYTGNNGTNMLYGLTGRPDVVVGFKHGVEVTGSIILKMGRESK